MSDSYDMDHTNILMSIQILAVSQIKLIYTYVTRYKKIDHSRFFVNSAFLVWIDAEFNVEFNGLRSKLKKGS